MYGIPLSGNSFRDCLQCSVVQLQNNEDFIRLVYALGTKIDRLLGRTQLTDSGSFHGCGALHADLAFPFG